MRITLALPAYNEEAGLPRVLESFAKALKGSGHEAAAAVVDDGSTDGTARVIEEWAARLPMRVMKHPVNRGLGETIRDALRLALEDSGPDDVVVAMDADDTHPPELILEMLPLLANGCDIAIASRYRTGARVVGLSAFRHAMSYGARALYQTLFPIRGVRDYTCAFRAYRASVLRAGFARYGDALVTERGFASMAELLLKLARCGARVAEVPMTLRYDRKGGTSKMNVARTVAKTLRLMLRLRFTL